MFFIVIIAFALLLADGLPPGGWSLLPLDVSDPSALARTSFVIVSAAVVTVVLAAGFAAWVNRRTLHCNDGSPAGLDRAQAFYTYGNLALLTYLAFSLLALFIATPWAPLVRRVWGLGDWPLLAELVLLSPFAASVLLVWTILYPADRLIRTLAVRQRALDGVAVRPIWGHGEYLVYKLRHQVLIVAVPMMLILLAKHFIDDARADINAATRVPWASEALLGLVSCTVLLVAPVLIRLIWDTSVLPPGPLRQRLERHCQRMGLRYRDILVWNSHGLIVNAAVMGFVGPLRYVLLSDGLLETMSPAQIEAVFGHEAGHIRHYHLQFFLVFAALSMLVVGGLLEILVRTVAIDPAALQLLAMAATLAVWGAGFGWISRRFERQADVFGVRAITPDAAVCTPDCAVHAPTDPAANALCRAAAHLFGGTLLRVAELNGIPRDAPSWRHGSINSRCRLIHTLADKPDAVDRFDRRLWRIKCALVLCTAIGVAIAAWLYWPSQLFSF